MRSRVRGVDAITTLTRYTETRKKEREGETVDRVVRCDVAEEAGYHSRPVVLISQRPGNGKPLRNPSSYITRNDGARNVTQSKAEMTGRDAKHGESSFIIRIIQVIRHCYYLLSHVVDPGHHPAK